MNPIRIGEPVRIGLGPGLAAVLFGLFVVTAYCQFACSEEFIFTLTPGVGHDRFTETFYLDDTASVSADSLARIRTTEDGLRETYGSLGAGLRHGYWQLTTTHYATNAAGRNISYGQGRWTTGRLRTDVSGRFEWKGTDDEDSLASAYTFYRIDIKPRYRIRDQWWLTFRSDWQAADYKQNNTYTVDYHRLRGRAGIEFLSKELQTLDLWIGAARQTVPDSSRLDYDETFLNLDATGWSLGGWRADAELAFTDRAYIKSVDGDDHQRWAGYMRAAFDGLRHWRLTWTGEWQYWDYAREDEALYDVADWRVEGSARAMFAGQWEAGGLIEWRHEQPTGDTGAENEYQQWAVGPIVVWNPSVFVWNEIILRVGYRGYPATSLIYDDYSFWELSVQFDGSIGSGPEVNIMASYLSERHDDSLRDIGQLYLSAIMRITIQP